MPPPRSGAVLGPKLIHLLKEWGIEKKIFLITLDNARYNDGVGGRLIEHFKLANSLLCDGNFVHIRCANHILNLIFKAGIVGACVLHDVLCGINKDVVYDARYGHSLLFLPIHFEGRIFMKCYTDLFLLIETRVGACFFFVVSVYHNLVVIA
ncbi:hypothetical protein T459_09330 [Capsicum annuum]|uniref:AC transposase n=1 Tax=Capsicum annuum TaxID=4072 RepID=A0A2G2ZZ18_CAPAN|nr:hypothetical protein T459_09330 [Capsicum annuum]